MSRLNCGLLLFAAVAHASHGGSHGPSSSFPGSHVPPPSMPTGKGSGSQPGGSGNAPGPSGPYPDPTPSGPFPGPGPSGPSGQFPGPGPSGPGGSTYLYSYAYSQTYSYSYSSSNNVPQLPPPPPLSGMVCLHVCTYSADGECDDGGPGSEFAGCNYGTDCSDCGERNSSDWWDVYSQPHPPALPPAPPANPGGSFTAAVTFEFEAGWYLGTTVEENENLYYTLLFTSEAVEVSFNITGWHLPRTIVRAYLYFWHPADVPDALIQFSQPIPQLNAQLGGPFVFQMLEPPTAFSLLIDAPSPPPPISPPLPPIEPGGDIKPVITVGLVVQGSVESFSQRQIAQTENTLRSNTNAESVSITIQPGSVNLHVRLVMRRVGPTVGAAITLFRNPTLLRTATGLPILSISEEPTLTTEVFAAPSPPPPAPGAPPPPWFSFPCAAGYQQEQYPGGTCSACTPGTYQTIATVGGMGASSGSNPWQVCSTCLEGYVQPLAAQASCLDCPSSGIDCSKQHAVDVKATWYRRTPLSTGEELLAFRCPQPASCLGGEVPGNASCVEGASGALCGLCLEGYRRGPETCEPCNEDSGVSTTTFTLSLIYLALGVGVLVGAIAYLRTWRVKHLEALLEADQAAEDRAANAKQPPPANRTCGGRCWACVRRLSCVGRCVGSCFDAWIGRKASRLGWRFRRHAAVIATYLKIAIGFCQCLGVFRHFRHVRWPEPFGAFVEALDFLTIDWRQLVSLECATGARLGFLYELIGSLSLPLLATLAVLLLAVSVWVVLTPPAQQSRCLPSPAALLRQPQVTNLIFWLLLLLYTGVCQRTAMAFVCVPYYDGAFLLAEDPVVECYTSNEWLTAATIAGVAIALACIGLPLALLVVVYYWRRGTTSQQQRVALLLHSYSEGAWFFEPLDLLRKWMLNSAVLWVMSNTKWQLIFGAFVSGGAITLNLVLKPYRERVCGLAANAALVQLQCTYVIALAFFEDEDARVDESAEGSRFAGWLLVALNVLSFVLFILYLLQSSADAANDVGSMVTTPQTKWKLSRDSLAAAGKAPTYACFLSHYKQEAASDARYLSDVLGRMLSAPVFLDSSDLSDLRNLFTRGVHRSDVIVVLATEHVLTRSWCLIEIFEAATHSKPVLFLAIAGKGFTLAGARLLLSNLEYELLNVSPSALRELGEYFGSPESIARNGQVTMGVLANTVLGALPRSEHGLYRLNLHNTDNRVMADVTDLVDGMAERTGRELQWKNKIDVAALAQLSSHRNSTAGKTARSHTRSRTRSRTRGRWHGRPIAAASAAKEAKQAEAPEAAEAPGWFLCFDGVKAYVHARSLQSWLQSVLREQSYLPDTGLNKEVATMLEEVRGARAVLLLLTEGCLLRPQLLLQCFWATEHNVPIVPLSIAGADYDYASARHTLTNLRLTLENKSPGAVKMLTEALSPLGISFDQLAARLQETIPHLISLPYSPHDSANQMLALVSDVVRRAEVAREQSGVPAESFKLSGKRAQGLPKPAPPPKPGVAKRILGSSPDDESSFHGKHTFQDGGVELQLGKPRAGAPKANGNPNRAASKVPAFGAVPKLDSTLGSVKV